MHTNHNTIFAAAPRRVSDNRSQQTDAFLDAVEALREKTEGDWTKISNEDWISAFGLYWGAKELVSPQTWTKLWTVIKAHIAHPDPEASGLELWAWFTRAMNWRREKVRTEQGQGAERWKALKKAPRKHAAHKARNAEAQRRRRARLPPDEPGWQEADYADRQMEAAE